MPPEEPSSRSEMLEFCEDLDWVAATQACGPGVRFRTSSDAGEVLGFTSLHEDGGWYVDSIDRGHDEVLVTVMPSGAGDE